MCSFKCQKLSFRLYIIAIYHHSHWGTNPFTLPCLWRQQEGRCRKSEHTGRWCISGTHGGLVIYFIVSWHVVRSSVRWHTNNHPTENDDPVMKMWLRLPLQVVGHLTVFLVYASVSSEVILEKEPFKPGDPVKPYDFLYKEGVQGYLEDNWESCVTNLERAIEDWHWSKENLARWEVGLLVLSEKLQLAADNWGNYRPSWRNLALVEHRLLRYVYYIYDFFRSLLLFCFSQHNQIVFTWKKKKKCPWNADRVFRDN